MVQNSFDRSFLNFVWDFFAIRKKVWKNKKWGSPGLFVCKSLREFNIPTRVFAHCKIWILKDWHLLMLSSGYRWTWRVHARALIIAVCRVFTEFIDFIAGDSVSNCAFYCSVWRVGPFSRIRSHCPAWLTMLLSKRTDRKSVIDQSSCTTLVMMCFVEQFWMCMQIQTTLDGRLWDLHIIREHFLFFLLLWLFFVTGSSLFCSFKTLQFACPFFGGESWKQPPVYHRDL